MTTGIYLGNPSENIVNWIKQKRLKEPLCFITEEPNTKMSFNKEERADYDNQVVFSYDKKNWLNYEFGSEESEITLANIGDKVYFRAADDIENQSFDGYYFDINNGKIAASGNINTLLKADGSVLNLTERVHCYRSMFENCTSLTQAPELPATTLDYGCYTTMFLFCVSLTKAPELPATELTNNCYSFMFWGCTSLTQAPELPATALAGGCYYCMFRDCTSLTQASFPNLEKETVATEVVKNQDAFIGAASDIEATCKDGILIINSTSV